MKTATSLVVVVVVPSVLEEWLRVHVAHRSVVELHQDAIDVAVRTSVRKVRRRWSSTGLELAVEEFVFIDHCIVVADMPKALAE